MPYTSIDQLPHPVRNVLPEHAQEIYMSAFNSAYHEYRSNPDREVLSHKVAWAAVKKTYTKGTDGRWHKQ